MFSCISGVAKRVFWITAVLLMSLGLTYNLVLLTIRHYSYPVMVSVSLETKSQLGFPAVTLCNMSPVRRSMWTKYKETPRAQQEDATGSKVKRSAAMLTKIVSNMVVVESSDVMNDGSESDVFQHTNLTLPAGQHRSGRSKRATGIMYYIHLSKQFCILGLTAHNYDLVGRVRAHYLIMYSWKDLSNSRNH